MCTELIDIAIFTCAGGLQHENDDVSTFIEVFSSSL